MKICLNAVNILFCLKAHVFENLLKGVSYRLLNSLYTHVLDCHFLTNFPTIFHMVLINVKDGKSLISPKGW